MEDYKWITLKDGRRIRIKITNAYMNDKIRNDYNTNKNKKPEYEKGKFVKEDFKYVFDDKGNYKKVNTDAYYELDNGETINFMDEKNYKRQITEFYDSLTPQEKDVLYEYVSSSGWFYANGEEYGLRQKQTLKERLDTVDKLFKEKAFTTSEDTLVFRRGSENNDQIKEGFTKERMLSTSAYNKLPKNMPSGKPFGDKEYYIILPKGIKYLPIEMVATDDVAYDRGEKAIFKRQHELLLEPGLKFQLIQDNSEIHHGYANAHKDNKYKYVLLAKK